VTATVPGYAVVRTNEYGDRRIIMVALTEAYAASSARRDKGDRVFHANIFLTKEVDYGAFRTTPPEAT
jgi:hypothetical protein